MEKAKLVHLKNKYPHCYVGATGSCMEVIDSENNIIVSLVKDAHGAYVDRQHEVGARDAFCLSPIPKEGRLFKLAKDGKVQKDELFYERKSLSEKIIKQFGKIPSIDELIKLKRFDEHKGEVKFQD